MHGVNKGVVHTMSEIGKLLNTYTGNTAKEWFTVCSIAVVLVKWSSIQSDNSGVICCSDFWTRCIYLYMYGFLNDEKLSNET